MILIPKIVHGWFSDWDYEVIIRDNCIDVYGWEVEPGIKKSVKKLNMLKIFRYGKFIEKILLQGKKIFEHIDEEKARIIEIYKFEFKHKFKDFEEIWYGYLLVITDVFAPRLAIETYILKLNIE